MKIIYINIYIKLSRLSHFAMLVHSFLGGAGGKEPTYHWNRHKRCGFDPWVRKIPWRRAWQPIPVFLPENPMDRGAWWATVHRITELDTTKVILQALRN